MSDQVGEKRSLAEAQQESGPESSEMPLEKKAKLDPDTAEPTPSPTTNGQTPHPPPPTEENNEPTPTPTPAPAPVEDASAHDASLFGDDLAVPGAVGEDEDMEDLKSLQLSPRSLAQASSTVYDTTEEENSTPAPAHTSSPPPQGAPESPSAGASTDNIPYPPGYNPQQVNQLSDPLQPVVAPSPRRTRRTKKEQMMDAYPDPESKWCEAATERMIRLFAEFGKRHVLDEKMHNELKMCLDHGGNPAVLLSSRDGLTFFTYLTVAAECGDMELVEIFLTHYKDEFSEYDLKVSLEAALRKREQEIAEYILRHTQVQPTNEAVMEMCDVHMNDELKRKTLPLQAFLDVCLGARFPPQEFYVPEILNRCIYAHNVAALQLLFERAQAHFLPLLTQATPESNIIRAGRGKSQDIGEGVPPLTYAAVMERTECLEVFLSHGADPNFVWNDMGGSLLHIAAHKGNMEMIELLVQAGADPRLPNDVGATVLSRTKGLKARKLITDTMEALDQQEGIIRTPAPSALPPPHAPGPMGYGGPGHHPGPAASSPMGMPMHLHSPGPGPSVVNSYGNTPVVLPNDPTMHHPLHGGGHSPSLPPHDHHDHHDLHDHGPPSMHHHGHHGHHDHHAHPHLHHSGDAHDMAQPPPFEGHEEATLRQPPTHHQPVDLMDVAHHTAPEGAELTAHSVPAPGTELEQQQQQQPLEDPTLPAPEEADVEAAASSAPPPPSHEQQQGV